MQHLVDYLVELQLNDQSDHLTLEQSDQFS